jgi:pyruvate formate lyase activating enzyme
VFDLVMLNINSFQSLGAVDGPGVRFVVFMQGCNFKCRYCHNPETIKIKENNLMSVNELINKIDRFKSYIFDKGGVTFSGGEPLLQAKELILAFKLLKEKGYHIALDTNGSILNDDVKKLLEFTDLVLLDLKMPNEEKYFEFIGASNKKVLEFLDYLKEISKDVWVRQVVIKGVNNTKENIVFLRKIKELSIVKKIESKNNFL